MTTQLMKKDAVRIPSLKSLNLFSFQITNSCSHLHRKHNLVILVSLAPHMDFASYVHQYYKSGYLVYQEGGEAGKVCVDHMNKTVPKSEVGRVLNKLGESMCNTLEYRDLVSIEIMVDNEQEVT